MLDFLKKYLFSTRLMALLFIVFAAAMGIGTFIESKYSTETARIFIYNAKWFEAIMLFFVINFLGNISRYKLLQWKKWPVLVLHLSWILIILGAFVTRYISYEGVMPIREGQSENIFYSDKTYISAFIDGDIDGQLMRKTLPEQPVIITPEGKRANFPYKGEFNGIDFSIDYVDFIEGVKKGMVPKEGGKKYLKIVEAGDGQRHEHYLEDGQVSLIHNILFALNNETQDAINIFTSDSIYQIRAPYQGGFMRMADQFQGEVIADSLQTLQLRSLYNMAGMQFVIPEPVVEGEYGIVEVPKNEITEETANGLVVNVTVGNESKEVTILGGKGPANFTDKIKVGGLEVALKYGSKEYELPFKVKLNDFIAEKYPGTVSSYKSFMSKVTVEDERSFDYDIFMNNILDHRGYRFFQASFMPDEKGTVLSVNHDQWGTWITYVGYFLLYIGLMGIMFFGDTRFRKLATSLEKVKSKKAVLGVMAFLFFGITIAQQGDGVEAHNTMPTDVQIDSILKATTVSEEHADKFGALVVQDEGGRMKPLHTFTSELLRKLSGKDKFKNMNSDQVFISMMMNPAAWYNTKFISIDFRQNDSIREIIGVDKTEKFIKATQLFDATGMYKLKPYLEEATATTNPSKFQKDFIKTHERFSLLNMALSGEILKIYPLLDDENNKWISPIEYRSGQYTVQDSLYANFMQNSIPYYLNSVQGAINSKNYATPDKLLEAFKQNQKNHGAEVLPSDKRIQTEILYNKLDIFNRLYRYYGLIGALLFFVLVFRIFKDRELWKAATYVLKGTIVLFFIWHTAGLLLRWYISGHAPWSNAYESILYVAWATMGMGLLFMKKSDLTLSASAFVAAMLLWIAHQSWVDPAIANLVPVLDSYWLMIHVAVIVGSYGPLTVGMILGVTALLLIILTNKKNKKRMDLNLQELTIINELSLTIGLVMLTIGNFLGGQWANESWGRYWGWDPKETWALVSIMVYAFVIHMRFVPGLRGKWIYNFMSVVAYGSIMMTYFGVNFYLVGLHSYAQSGSAAITPDYVKYIVLGVLILGGISYWRYKANYVKS
ncbi:cytochrome c biogenesis protein CcsA [Croceivirga lutea]|uniref:cytochrome c biogenesis protein CcsA n=1 Tax=Croceivirga lutea TaxID=1775167 RepID=UPI00163B21D0|nr:cytochrome c biogenesis protein CcsA [Croceivirga lutea]